jgi:hypothetical protein
MGEYSILIVIIAAATDNEEIATSKLPLLHYLPWVPKTRGVVTRKASPALLPGGMLKK